jgi:hypothetical protein
MTIRENINSSAHVTDLSDQATVIYQGWYNDENPGWETATTASRKGEAKWKILRITISANVHTKEWAEGNEKFDKVWDDRASLNYSFKS